MTASPGPGPRPGDDGTVWITSDAQPDGTYAATLALTPDRAIALDEPAAVRYALAVLHTAAAADYDAAVLAQLQAIGVGGEPQAAHVVARLRAERPARPTGTPLALTPGISHRTRKGFLSIAIAGHPAGQWDTADARSHALGILECLTAARHDTAYHAVLTSAIGLDTPTARAVVAGLLPYLPGGTP